jgi:hypothetical protein
MSSFTDKFRIIEKTISDEKPGLVLFGLFLREDAQDKWDLVLSADWLTGDYFSDLGYVTKKLQTYLDSQEMTAISRIILLKPEDRFVRTINGIINIEHGKAEFEDCRFNDVSIKHAIIVTSKRRIRSTIWDQRWINAHRTTALGGLRNLARSGFMEIQFALVDSILNVTQSELLRQAKPAQIETFGWPIGVIIDRKGYRPKPSNDGIITEILIQDQNGRSSYDYWTLRKDGAFYLLKSIFEDERRPGYIFFNTRIVRITETLLYAARLYSGLNVPRTHSFAVGIRHGGLKDRILSTSSPARRFPPSETNVSGEDEVYSEIETTIQEIESNTVDLVERFTQPLFVVFNFFELDKAILSEVVNKYIAGEVT